MDFMNFDKENEQLKQESALFEDELDKLRDNQIENTQQLNALLGKVNELRKKWNAGTGI